MSKQIKPVLRDQLESSARRGFMKSTSALGGALVVGLPSAGVKRGCGQGGRRAGCQRLRQGRCQRRCHHHLPSLRDGAGRVHLDADAGRRGTGRSAVGGQGEMAPSAPVYINAMLGGQITGGSTSVRDAWTKLREAGASARTVLVAAAAETWKVPATECTAANGVVSHKSGKKLAYGALVAKASAMKMPEKVALKDPKDWTIIGKQKARIDTPAKVAGKAQYGIDVKKPGMLIAALAQAPVIGGKVVKVNDAKARAVKGVVNVVQIPDGVAVLAKDFYTAKKVVMRWKSSGDNGPAANLDSLEIKPACAPLRSIPAL